MVSEGFVTTDPLYLAVSAIVAQDPRPNQLMVGRLASTWTQTIDVTPNAVNAAVYSGTIDGLAWTFTAADTVLANVCTGIASAIDALAGVTATGASGTKVVVTSDSAVKLHSFTVAATSTGTIEAHDSTAAAALETDLAAIRAATKDFYGLCLDQSSRASATAAAHWAEGEKIVFVAQCTDTGCLSSGSTTDIMYTLKASSYKRTVPMYHADPNAFIAAAMLGEELHKDPGSSIWSYKTLAGVAVSSLTEAQKSAVFAKNGSTYTSVGGANVVEGGTAASGLKIDLMIGADWLVARIVERLWSLILGVDKLPYTDETGDLVRGEILAQLYDGVAKNVIARGGANGVPAPSVFVPLVSSQSSADRGTRLMPGITFQARMAGAAEKFSIHGTLSI
jgi:hypothetical protein